MIVGLGAAAELVTVNLSLYSEHMAEMRNYLREQLIRRFQLVAGEEGGSLKAGEVNRQCCLIRKFLIVIKNN